jgi:hypothetical protein
MKYNPTNNITPILLYALVYRVSKQGNYFYMRYFKREDDGTLTDITRQFAATHGFKYFAAQGTVRLPRMTRKQFTEKFGDDTQLIL